MHFWIDKPAARYYGFSGRRYPATSFPKAHFGQHRRCGNVDVARLQVVTPVHRFQTINSGGNSAGPSNPNSNRPPRPTGQNINENRNNSARVGLQLEHDMSNNTNNSSINQSVLPPSTHAANRSLLNFSQFSDAEMAGYRLRCSVWIIFVLATGFLAAAKYYFDHQQGAGIEVLVFCGLVVTFFISGCFYSMICRRARNNQCQETQAEPIATVTVANTIPNESIRQVSMPIRPNPPPPYHIAILIPPPTSSDEAPPPAYDKIIQ